MNQNPLHKILSPNSIAVAGAGNNPAKMGTILYLNLIHGGFNGEVLAVHPNQEKIFGKTAYASAEKLPYTPDLAILIVPSRYVVSLLEDFGKIGTRHAIVVSAGFGETGTSGKTLESELIGVAKQYGMRIVGPNCLGVINSSHPLNTTVVPLQDKPGHLSLVSQSGTYVTQTLAYLKHKGVRIAKAISVGNEADIDLCDCLEYLSGDQNTHCIGLYIESIKHVDRFLQVARQIAQNKPIIAQYVGGTSAGARAGASHTGAMAGPAYLYDGLFQQAGIIRADTIEDVFMLGNALALSPAPNGSRIGILTNSGGPGTGMATTLEALGLDVPEFSEHLRKKLESFLPGHASSRNPVDLTFHTGMELMAETLPDILLQSGEIDGLLIHGIMDTGFADLLYPIFKDVLNVSESDFKAYFMADLTRLIAMPRKYNAPILISSFMGEEDHCLQTFRDLGIPSFDSPERAAHAMAALFEFSMIQKRLPDKPSEIEDLPIPEKAAEIMKYATSETMDEYMAKEVLRAYKMPTPYEFRVDSPQQAIMAADKIGYPVVVKGCAPDILHKTEQNLVHMDCRHKEDVQKACRAISDRVKNASFLISQMITSGREFMAGMIRFNLFPPCILFGIGGIFAETINDFGVRLAPFGLNEAMRLITSIKSHNLLSEFRGKPSADLKALADILIRLSHIALHFPQIREIDLNPILIDGNQPVIVDAVFVL
jgi:acetate---CoA ligase (ADP-forming)